MLSFIPMQKTVRILVVDDKPSVLLTYRMILQQNGHNVVAVPTYRQALEQLDTGVFDLLLCDLGLDENHSGFEVIEYAREKLPGLRSVLLTGYATPEIADQAAEHGVVVLFKPVEVEELLRTVHSGLSAALAIA
jgi:DNA-binding NtrC family response regulator